MILKYVLVSLLAVFGSLSMAENSSSWNDSELTPVISYFNSQVKVMKQTLYVHNWSNSGNGGEGEPYLNLAKKMSQVFWDRFGDPKGDQNMYGFGLYTAMDPVATQGYGYADKWSLLELQIPKGLKVIDLTSDSPSLNAEKTAALDEIQTKFSCPTFTKLNGLFENGGKGLTPSCQNLIRHIFKDVLQIGGFFYSYDQSNFKACAKGGFSKRALVVTDPQWLKTESVRFFNKQSSYAKEDRIRIQTLFLEERKSKIELTGSAKSIITQYLNKNIQKHFAGSRSTCADAQCEIYVRFCDQASQCDEFSVGSYPRPGGPTITQTEALTTDRKGLLWSDLEGEQKMTTTTEWLQANTFGCSGQLPYENNLQN